MSELSTILAELEAAGSEQTRKTYRRHGLKDPMFGVSYAFMGKLARKLRGRSDLADELWASGILEARTFATMIAQPEAARARRWLEDVTSNMHSIAVAEYATKAPGALELGLDWAARPGEWPSSTGYNLLANLAAAGAMPPETARDLLQVIEREIHTRPNYTRYTMNGTVIAIGGCVPGLAEEAIATAERIGKVEVDHGNTACKTPDAVPYIRKTLAHTARKAAFG
jgi:hypothetical protein